MRQDDHTAKKEDNYEIFQYTKYRKVAAPRVSGFFFKALVQALLLFGAETLVVTPHMGTALGGFHTQVERRLTGQLPRRTTDGTWKYTSAAAAMEAVGFLTMEE